MDMKKRNQILNGKLFPVIIYICAPLFIYNFFNSCYSIIDSILVSNINATSISAVASLGQVSNLLQTLGMGLAGGGGIIVARLFGADRIDEARKNSNVLFSMGGIIVVILYVICLPLALPIMKISKIPDELITIGTSYFIVQILNLGFIVFNSILISLQKAKGNTLPILLLNIMSMLIKVALSFIFIFGMNVQNIIWLSVATLASQFVLFAVLLTINLQKSNIFRLSFNMLSLRWKYVKPILVMSIPIFIGKFIFAYGKVSVNAMSSTYGPLVVGALGVSNNMNGLATSPVNSIEEGESTIISQNLGNRNLKRALGVFTRSFLIAVVLGLIGYVLIRFALQAQLIALFQLNSEAADSAQFGALVKSIHRYDSLSIPSLAISSAVLGLLYGFGQTKLSMVLNISRVFVFRIPVLWYLQKFHSELGAECTGISMAISNIAIALTSVAFLIFFLIKIKKKGYKGMFFDHDEATEDII